MSDILLSTVVDKVNAQEKKIAEMQGTLKNVPGHAEEIRQIKKEVVDLKTTVKDISFPTKEMRELSTKLTESISLLRQPVTNKVLHHHYVPKSIWIAAVLFIGLAVVCSGWYMTINSLSKYKANDTKYRFLKLNNNKSLQQLLFITDSLYRIDPRMRDSVLWRGQGLQEQLGLQRRLPD